jgi:hypothetical protein
MIRMKSISILLLVLHLLSNPVKGAFNRNRKRRKKDKLNNQNIRFVT